MTGAVAATAMGAMAAVNVIPLPNKVVEGDGALAFANPGAVAAAVTEADDASIPAEGYRLTVSDAGIRIEASDAAGRFQMVYVKDAAEAIMECVRQAAAGGQAFNLAAPEVLDYGRFMETLRAVSDRPFTTRSLTVEESFREGIPLPFPLTAEESELYDGEKITRTLGLNYTPFREGMEKTFIAFRSVYE